MSDLGPAAVSCLHGLKLWNALPGDEMGGFGCLLQEESEYETDSEEEQLDQQRLKPLFVKREEREVRAWQYGGAFQRCPGFGCITRVAKLH